MSASEDEVVLKLLHTADWHLGRRFGRFGDAQTRLMRARLEVIERILLVAERNAVDAVLCAGDLFDDPCPERTWWEPLAAIFAKQTRKDRPIVLLPGNHDPCTPDSVWKREEFRRSLPSFVHVVDREDFELPLRDVGVLYAVPCFSQAGQNDPTEKIPTREADDPRIRIGIVHGSTFDARDCQTNFPIHADAALLRGLDYLALGDTHGFRFVPSDREQPPTIYPGAPEPTAFDERDPGHVAIVLLNRQRRARVQKEPVARWTWEEARVASLSELRQLARRTDLSGRVLRLTVAMRVSAPEYEEVERLLEDLAGTEARSGKVGILELDREQLALDTASVAAFCEDLPQVLQIAVERLKAVAANPDDRPAAERALYHLYRMSRKAS